MESCKHCDGILKPWGYSQTGLKRFICNECRATSTEGNRPIGRPMLLDAPLTPREKTKRWLSNPINLAKHKISVKNYKKNHADYLKLSNRLKRIKLHLDIFQKKLSQDDLTKLFADLEEVNDQVEKLPFPQTESKIDDQTERVRKYLKQRGLQALKNYLE